MDDINIDEAVRDALEILNKSHSLEVTVWFEFKSIILGNNFLWKIGLKNTLKD
jgi:hypothetical protein